MSAPAPDHRLRCTTACVYAGGVCLVGFVLPDLGAPLLAGVVHLLQQLPVGPEDQTNPWMLVAGHFGFGQGPGTHPVGAGVWLALKAACLALAIAALARPTPIARWLLRESAT